MAKRVIQREGLNTRRINLRGLWSFKVEWEKKLMRGEVHSKEYAKYCGKLKHAEGI